MSNLTCIFSILSSFEQKKLNKFKDFLNSPYHGNKYKELLDLFTGIQKYLLKRSDIDKDNIVDYFFTVYFVPKHANENKSIKSLKNKVQKSCAFFHEKLEEFIVFESIEQNEEYKNLILSNYYQEKELDKCLERNFKKSIMKIEKKPINDGLDNFVMYNLYKDKYDYEIRKDIEKKKGIDNKNLQKAVFHLEVFYLIDRLKSQCFMVNDSNIIRTPFDETRVAAVLCEAEDLTVSKIPLVEAYYNCLKVLTDIGDKESYNNIKEILNRKDLKLPDLDKQNLFDILINFFTLNINSGNDEYSELLFELNEMVIRSDLFYLNGCLDTQRVKNIVTAALWLNKLDWAEEFVIEFKNKFNPVHREDLYNFSFAHLSFFKKEYKKAHRYLDNVNLKERLRNKIFVIEKSKLKIKILYCQLELDECEVDDLEKAIEKFKGQISMLKKAGLIPFEHEESYNNFIRIISQLHNNIEREKIKKILKKAEEWKLLAERKWLTEKNKEKLKKSF